MALELKVLELNRVFNNGGKTKNQQMRERERERERERDSGEN